MSTGVWAGPIPDSDEEVRSSHDIAHQWTNEALHDSELDPMDRLRVALGLLELLDEYWVTVEIGWMLREEQDPGLNRMFWDAYRRFLDASELLEAVTYSLWVDWFEDSATVREAFAETLGDDLPALVAEGAQGSSFHRAQRVLEISGPVPWSVKHGAYQIAATVTDLHPALFKGLLSSYHDVYGDLEPRAALDVLRKLDLPADTEHLAPLRAVLAAGKKNHYKDPSAWDAASTGGSS